MIKVKLRPEQGIKVKTTPAQSPDVKLKTVYLYDADWIPEINKAVEEANESAESAKTSAESAEASANSAAESARNADADADNAAESAGLAAQEATKANESATKATKEADASAESAYQAQLSALAAAEYAQNASSDAENAVESLEHVLISLAQVKTSEQNAKESETKAKESEQKATQEANASAESAYQSQQSALAAYEYASNAEADATNVRETLDLVLDAETAATNAAQTATEKAQQATDGANIATQKAGVSTEQANIATEKADEASQFALECQEIKNSLGSVYKFKGSVNTFDDLPTVGNEIGDVYNIIDTDKNYAWDGEKWDDIGGTVDLSDYALKTDIPTKTSELENDSGFITAEDVPETDLTGYLQDTATAANALSISGTPLTQSNGMNIGPGSATWLYGLAVGVNANSSASNGAMAVGNNSSASANESAAVGNYAAASGSNGTAVGASASAGKYGTAIGSNAGATKSYSIALGMQAKATAERAVQIGYGNNTEASSVYIGYSSAANYKLLDANGKIPAGRLPDTHATKEYVDTTEQEIIQNFMEADTALQTQITGLSGVLAEEQNKIEAIEGKIPTNASSSNLLSTASDLLNATQDVRADFAEADSELQTQINGQATAIAGKQEKLTAGENITIENNVISSTGGSSDITDKITNCITEIPQDIKLNLGRKKYGYILGLFTSWSGLSPVELEKADKSKTYTLEGAFASNEHFDVVWSSSRNAWVAPYVDEKGNSLEGTVERDSSLDVEESGVLVLKAGSKVYVPNGAGKFDEVILSSDLTKNDWASATGDFSIFLNSSGSYIYASELDLCASGTSTSSIAGMYYRIGENYIYARNNSDNGRYSFPLAIVHLTNGVPDSIKQVFNGFGYIGSTMFALPGLKGLIPNGRNEDGSLKNIEFTLNKVITGSDYDNGVVNYSMIYHNDETGSLSLVRSSAPGTTYDSASNTIYRGDGLYPHSVMIAIVYGSSGITSFQPKNTFHALDYNDKSEIIKWSMPSNKFDALTLGASGTQYTAPANGYFCLFCVSSDDAKIIAIQNISTPASILGSEWVFRSTASSARLWCPAKKGDIIKINYSATTLSNKYFYFIYAQGENQ